MEIKLNDRTINFLPIDSIEFGKDGVIVWLQDGFAEAWRLERKEWAKEIRRIIDFKENKTNEHLLSRPNRAEGSI